MAEQQLNIYATYAYTDAYWALSDDDRKAFRTKLVSEAQSIAPGTHFYSVFPCRSDTDFMLWSALVAEQPEVSSAALINYNRVSEGWKRYIKPVQVLWGFTGLWSIGLNPAPTLPRVPLCLRAIVGTTYSTTNTPCPLG